MRNDPAISRSAIPFHGWDPQTTDLDTPQHQVQGSTAADIGRRTAPCCLSAMHQRSAAAGLRNIADPRSRSRWSHESRASARPRSGLDDESRQRGCSSQRWAHGLLDSQGFAASGYCCLFLVHISKSGPQDHAASVLENYDRTMVHYHISHSVHSSVAHIANVGQDLSSLTLFWKMCFIGKMKNEDFIV